MEWKCEFLYLLVYIVDSKLILSIEGYLEEIGGEILWIINCPLCRTTHRQIKRYHKLWTILSE